MTHGEFNHLLQSIDALSPEQMQQLSRALADRMAAAQQADAPPTQSPSDKPIWERVQERTAAIPDAEFERLPTDLAEQHDHYLYGTPQRPRR